MKFLLNLAFCLGYTGVYHALAAPAPQSDEIEDALIKDPALIPRLCQTPPAVPYDEKQKGMALPDPRTYKVEVYPLEDIVLRKHALSSIEDWQPIVNAKDQDAEVDPTPSLQLPGSRIKLQFYIVGDKNIIWHNVADCLTALYTHFEALTENIVPFAQCVVHENNYLQARAEMIGLRHNHCPAPKTIEQPDTAARVGAA